jgi:uncharacterized protein
MNKLLVMDEVKLNVNEKGRGAFTIMEGEEQIGEMAVGISGDNMTVYHTEVAPEAEGKGYAKQLLKAMTDYARDKQLKVTPRCPYVHAQFKRHPEEYADIWQKDALEM